MKKIYVVLLVFFLFSCKSQQNRNLHPFQRIENYNGNVNLTIEDKLLNTPKIIIDIINNMDHVDYYSSYELDNHERELFLNYFNFLPKKYKEIIEEKVVGIYFVNNFLGGGMTTAIFDKAGNMYIAMFLNPKILHKNISEWINFRDNSAFTNVENIITLKIECDSEFFALIHTLVHEASHVYDYYNFLTPYTEKILINKKFPTEFVENIWIDYNIPNLDFDYSEREYMSFYNLGEKLNINDAIKIYFFLENTPFSSLYGSLTWAEDFAESFTWYYLRKYFNVEYITTIYKNERIMLIYNPNLNQLVKSRYKIFEIIE